jgi:hypothetical protein
LEFSPLQLGMASVKIIYGLTETELVGLSGKNRQQQLLEM